MKRFVHEDPKRRVFLPSETVWLTRVRDGSRFNASGETLKTWPVEKKRAVKRLAKILSVRKDGWCYFASSPLRFSGRYGYHVAQRYTRYLPPAARAQKVRQLIDGRKSALSRILNRARAVKREYETSLFPEEHSTDPRYLALVTKIPGLVAAVRAARRMGEDEVEVVVGGIEAVTAGNARDFLEKLEGKKRAVELVARMFEKG